MTQYLLVIIQNELVALMRGLRDHAKLLSDVVMSFCWRSEPRMMGLTKVLDNIPLQVRPQFDWAVIYLGAQGLPRQP